MGVRDVSLILWDTNPSKIFSYNSWNYDFSYTEKDINLGPLTFALEKSIYEKKRFQKPIQSNNEIFSGFKHIKFCLSGDAFFQLFCFVKHSKDTLI